MVMIGSFYVRLPFSYKKSQKGTENYDESNGKKTGSTKKFYEYVKDNVKEYLPESYKDAEIKLQEVVKNNGLKLTGITIPKGNQRTVPTVYLDSLYQKYVNGKDADSCVGDVADNGMKNAWQIKWLQNTEISMLIMQ